MDVHTRFQSLGTVQIAVRNLQSPIRTSIPSDARAGRIKAGTIKIVSILVRFAPGKHAAFHFESPPDDSQRRNAKSDVAGILPVMRNRSVRIIWYRPQSMHKGRRTERGLARVTKIKIGREIAVELL